MKPTIQFLEYVAYNLRYWSIMSTSLAQSGHPTTCLSAADIMAVLFFDTMQFDLADFNNPNNDRFILSKGHASALLYAVWQQLGQLTEDDLKTYRKIDSILEGHPTYRFPYAQAATGSLGMGLSIGAGIALAARQDKRNYHTFVLLGDSETAEGSVWEAVEIAAHYKLENLTAIIDCNRLGQSTETMLDRHLDQYKKIFTGFGWHAEEVDGHNVEQLQKALQEARNHKGSPVVILANTIKGYGVDSIADKEGHHGVPFKQDQLDAVLEQLKNKFATAASYVGQKYMPALPKEAGVSSNCDTEKISLPVPVFEQDKLIATRKAYGQALTALGGVCESVVCLDAEVKNSTFAELFEKTFPNRFVQCFVAEQNMVSMAVGMSSVGKIPFVSTFGAFFARAYDQIRMAVLSNAPLRLVGSHVGVSIGQDGPSQMALEDIALMRALPNSIVLYPSDAISTAQLVEQMAKYHKGISYMRTTRADTPLLYDVNEEFFVGGCKVLRETEQDKVCIIAAGITVHEALKAHLELQQAGIAVAVIDLYSIKPFDAGTVRRIARAAGNKIVVVEDHYQEGGIAETLALGLVNSGIEITSLAVTMLPRSGKPEELLRRYGIDSTAIVRVVKTLI